MAKIIYTHTDEAPMLATYSFLPVIEAFASTAGVEVEKRDISLAGRIIAAFSDVLPQDQRVEDALAELGELTADPEANIIKLPNISASVSQLKAAIKELQALGYDIPAWVESPSTDAERDARARYDAVRGSAVNPVLRQGNSDRRAPASVKQYARRNPHSMGEWSSDSRTEVVTMDGDDFFATEQSVTIEQAGSLHIRHIASDGTSTELRDPVDVEAGEIVDASVMRAAALDAFLAEQVRHAKDRDVLFSAHLKATMMKVSDPVIFGHVVKAYFADVFAEYGDDLQAAGISARDGLASIFADLEGLSNGEEIRAAFDKGLANGPSLAMVDSDRGVTSLHVPSDVIVDASMPAMIRTSGKMWGSDGDQHDALAVIPDSSYAGLYQAVIEDCKANGAYDPATMGSVPNVGLMAQAAEEYGSHDKTFIIDNSGRVEIVDDAGVVLTSHDVEPGDIWRACQTKDVPVRTWIELAVDRARASDTPAVFWLDADRAHDAQLIAKIDAYLPELETEGLSLQTLAPTDAARHAVERIRRGEDTISVTGNVLRDYNTDLFPILELGTSAKMLSIVPLINGGGLFETGAGGSAPKHVRQLLDENYLRWDSLGEFLALASSFEHLATRMGNERAQILADTLDRATATFLNENRSPGRKLGTIDNRGSHAYLAAYWAEELAGQQEDSALAEAFAEVARQLRADGESILDELLSVQGEPADIGGYYRPNRDQAISVMRPSATFNRILDELQERAGQ